MVDLVDLHRHLLGDVVAHQLEAVVVEQVLDVGARAGEEVVEADDLVAFVQQPLAQVRAEETRATGDQNSPSRHRQFFHKSSDAGCECSVAGRAAKVAMPVVRDKTDRHGWPPRVNAGSRLDSRSRCGSKRPPACERYFRRAGNLSRGGLRLEHTIPLPIGTIVNLTFTLPGDTGAGAGLGRDCLSAGAEELRMGVKFIDLTPEAQAQHRRLSRPAGAGRLGLPTLPFTFATPSPASPLQRRSSRRGRHRGRDVPGPPARPPRAIRSRSIPLGASKPRGRREGYFDDVFGARPAGKALGWSSSHRRRHLREARGLRARDRASRLASFDLPGKPRLAAESGSSRCPTARARADRAREARRRRAAVRAPISTTAASRSAKVGPATDFGRPPADGSPRAGLLSASTAS